MRRKWIFFVAPPAAVLLVYLFGELVKFLWNALLPPLFGLHAITFWQGLGLLLLSRILFGGWGHGHGRRGRARAEHWERMTPEEREQFRLKMRMRWGRPCAPPSETKEPA
jgi:hypothetical protein